jgi:hypothetical protein
MSAGRIWAMTSTGRPLPPDPPDQEPELPMPRQKEGKS